MKINFNSADNLEIQKKTELFYNITKVFVFFFNKFLFLFLSNLQTQLLNSKK